MNCTFKLALLSSLSWISVSGFQFHTAVAQTGEGVTLWCSNMSTYRSQVFWFKLDDRARCISSMLNAESAPSSYEPFQPDKFTMESDSTNISLRIKPLDANDSGLYICGHYFDAFPTVFTATYLKVEEISVDSSEEPDAPEHLMNWILGAIIIFLLIALIGFIVKIRTLSADRKTLQHHENLDSHDMNYAALSFPPKTKSNRRPEAQRDLETNVLYSATRQTY
ncbi:uncharacterized protein LOC129378296 [Poeciliopsis prolifica]|uniref:uncharacterized protein LOC129378296 n=1 Tax=Poeciliopsis prolifica TaxID=188132 RepID=UPI0024141917|nr:uncharacterized protein LOC129378296 [Poeciliopsis prolifica]